MSLTPKAYSRFLSSLFICILFCSVAYAAPKDESLFGEIQRARGLIGSQQLIKARPLLMKLRKNPEVDANMYPTLDFYVALSYVFEHFETNNKGSLDTALSLFNAFIQKNKNNSLVPIARYNIADIHAISKNFEEALKGYIALYNNPVPGIERKEVLKKIILIYIAEKKWEAGIPYFEAGIRSAESGEERTTYAAYILIAKAKLGDVSDSRQLLEFFNSPAPVFYTPRFNASLMEVGDQLRSEGDLATASLFYQFVRSYESLQVGLSNHIRHLEQKLAQLEGNIVLRNFAIATQTELDNAMADLAALEASTNYTPLLNWRIASVYMDMGRDWEAFWRFRVMVDTYPDHEYAEDILFSSFSLGRKLGEFEEAENLSERYLANRKFTRYRATVSDEITTDYLELEEYEKLYEMTRWYLRIAPEDRAASLLLFKYGMARLMRFETIELIDDFQGFKDKYGNTDSSLVIDYFLGLGHLTEQNNQEALELFEEVIHHPNTRFKADASFRKALCVMGLDRLDEARILILDFVRMYPDNPLRAQAELVLGNLDDILGDSESALGHYYLIEKYTDDLNLLATGELKITRIMVDKGEVNEAIARLKAFIDANPESPEIIPVVAALSQIYSDAEQPRVALNTIISPLVRFFEMTEVDQLDALLVDYLRKDRAVREVRIKTEAFLDTVSNSPNMLKDLVGDRGKQYVFFKENSNIDSLVKNHFVKDKAFRKEILDHYKALDTAHNELVAAKLAENPNATPPIQKPYPVVAHPVLVELEREVDELNENIPVQTADSWLNSALAKANASDNIPLVIRIMAAFAVTQEPPSLPTSEITLLADDPELWPQIGLAGKLWILKERAKSHTEDVIYFLENARVEYMNTSTELGMQKLLAESYAKVDRIPDSIEAYRALIKRFAASDESGDAAIKIGIMLIDQGDYDEARDELELILHRNEWRGERHGEALMWIGRAYVAEGKYAEAHGFFERIMLGYPGFNELLATAYYEDIRVLKKMGEASSAQTVYEAFKMTPGLDETETAELIRKEFE